MSEASTDFATTPVRTPHTIGIAGADEGVGPEQLAAVSQRFPEVEWGILISASREGTPRYPGRAWRASFLEATRGARRAAHLCGEAVLRFARKDPDLEEELLQYDRVQINFAVTRMDMFDIQCLAARVAETDRPYAIITQRNIANLGVLDLLGRSSRHQVLFDSSLGGGHSPSSWPEAIEGVACGYAGGLGPEVLTQAIPQIARATKGMPYWIDMESGVRTDDRLDLDKVEAVVRQVRGIGASDAASG